MPFVERPDGVEIHYETRGEGRLVVLAHHSLWSYPDTYAELIADLTRDHRLLLVDARGCGRSSRSGPYEPATDAADLEAVVEAEGGNALGFAVVEGFNRAVRVATARPDLIDQLIAVGPAAAAMLPRGELTGSGVMAASDSVMEMLLKLLNTEPRAALRTLIRMANPEIDEDDLRERVDRASAYVSLEAANDRTRAWLEDDVSEQARTLGDRLWILHGEREPWFEGALGERVAALFPKAHVEPFAGGPVSHPDLMAATVRRIEAAQPAA
jgi:pimeloyl-ACP methyl ester carboxylesterase